MVNIPALVYQLSAMSYDPAKDSMRLRAEAEALLIKHVNDMDSELGSLRAERDRLLAGMMGNDEIDSRQLQLTLDM